MIGVSVKVTLKEQVAEEIAQSVRYTPCKQAGFEFDSPESTF